MLKISKIIIVTIIFSIALKSYRIFKQKKFTSINQEISNTGLVEDNISKENEKIQENSDTEGNNSTENEKISGNNDSTIEINEKYENIFNDCQNNYQNTVKNSANLINELFILSDKCQNAKKKSQRNIIMSVKKITKCLKDNNEYERSYKNYIKAADILRNNLDMCKSNREGKLLEEYLDDIYKTY